MYFIMAAFISQKEYAELNEEESISRQTGNSESVKNSYLEDESDQEQERSSSQYSDEDEDDYSNEDDASNESYDSVGPLKKENSPRFKQAKFDRNDSKNLLNSVYSSRLSMINNNDNVLRASHPEVNLNKNYIESDNNHKKSQYLSKKVFLHLPPSLYRLKLHTMELDSFEASKFSVQSHQVKNADFLQEFSILRQNYPLQSVDEINK
jgi:hypothetical protein